MQGDFAVIGAELANRLLKKGFQLVEIKEGKYTTIYYFADTEELYIEIENYFNENEESR